MFHLYLSREKRPAFATRVRIVSLLIVCGFTSLSFSQQVDFKSQIRPLLNEHCVACHGGVKQAADLSFVYQDQVDSVIEAGEPENSYLIERIVSDVDEERMPPPDHGRRLNAEEVELLEHWIEQGAQWGKHWAFEKPTRHNPSDNISKANDWGHSKIDAFVLARIQSAGLEPSPPAQPDRWFRRASIDITGLPPTLEQRDRFLADVEAGKSTAYADAVDRLLDSPSYGERWASPWLDAVRYADSRGLGLDGKRNIWKYRDWVIDALNSDMPYDKFTIAQLAGDLLPDASLQDLVATACHRLTQTNEEGGTDDEQFRVEAVIDRVNTTWQVWQGLSFGCVQCHSHPYDPIRHDEYYQFAAFFNNTADCDLGDDRPNLAVPLNSDDYPQARKLDRKISDAWHKIWSASHTIAAVPNTWKPVGDLQASSNSSTQVVVATADGRQEYQTRGTVAKSTTVTLEAPAPESLESLTAIRFTGLPVNPESAKLDSEWGFVISNIKVELLTPTDGTFAADEDTDDENEDDKWDVAELKIVRVVSDEVDPLLDPMDSLNAKTSNGVGAYTRMNYPRSGIFVLKQASPLAPGCRLRVSVAQNVFALGAFPLVAHRGRLDVSADPAWTDWATDDSRWQQLKELKAQRKKIRSVQTPVLSERSNDFYRPTAVFDRGNYLTKTEPVSPLVPDFVSGGFDPSQRPANRLDMARWLVHPSNPLTSRVMVNRVWGQIFGIGLVETQEDFGSAGTPPSHPLLLDDLAVRFREDMKWSIKSLVRELVLSATYRQSSAASAAGREADTRNRWLSRGPRNRLPAEIVRDQALAISGLISTQMHGEPVHPPIPEGVWQPFQSGDKWKTAEKGDPNRYRRTIYTYTKRSIQFPFMASFDAPTREACSARRLPSNTPLQALMTLNDVVFLEASEALAQRMADFDMELRKQLEYGFVLATCREPLDTEVATLENLYKQTLLSCQAQTQEASEDSEKVFAMQQVASVLLNLDEVLNQ